MKKTTKVMMLAAAMFVGTAAFAGPAKGHRQPPRRPVVTAPARPQAHRPTPKFRPAPPPGHRAPAYNRPAPPPRQHAPAHRRPAPPPHRCR